MADCVGAAGWWLGHKYEARVTVTEVPRDAPGIDGKISAAELRSLMVTEKQTYHGDVCVRCGGIVNRPRSSSPSEPKNG